LHYHCHISIERLAIIKQTKAKIDSNFLMVSLSLSCLTNLILINITHPTSSLIFAISSILVVVARESFFWQMPLPSHPFHAHLRISFTKKCIHKIEIFIISHRAIFFYYHIHMCVRLAHRV
jgi:hypothetical protein